MLIFRRFAATSARFPARTRPAARKPPTKLAAAAATRPAVAAAPAASPASRASAAGATSSGSVTDGEAESSPLAANSFQPRLVPDMHTTPTTTSIDEVVDPAEVVTNVTALEETSGESLGDDWATSFRGLGSQPFEPRVVDILMAPVEPADVEITPDGLIYLPEIKYRRILNHAFGPGGWGIAPRTKTMVTKKQVTREYGLVCLGRLVSVSRGEMDYFSAEGITTAMEGCKSNALMRCCKDLGIASELWDPSFIRQFKTQFCESKFYEKRRRFVWKRKDRPWDYPYNQ